ncbi:bifunctional diguanylate cyclase/phosphodiesterase [Bradyrhizobium diazoefficiens]|uniref:Bifunctional diguanylate cyclase/phosphodiesterase n=1 Tax=Bradyrhizobium diazoefficiens TaxID=1355477 RepID=A0A809ZKP1_9BRAD|nr:EAL domain-containing protein [Bradyrhizobium diazoefficiens]WLA76956.1 EAL domain-containing protein [Bradyrhizobium diazoefficiens]BCE23681.1 bifunctional diguanylate cyclase/phosphodiesterase [Bradyrhizobium diazoefficiens]BCE49941.1 bifunctional diguanylate cyclase/phosphodiesterase [Bradyrhizobium diazoefficiens]BCE93449.1 bifunctional diguanylate cyclase/phosphodiesterase [Bradyrhizobium diazoefficiens]BCF28385.1 bifunctional diguanylate cyclase/phosphodiesterase [Bradyrhizobium diazo
MYQVLYCLTDQHDWRLVALGGAVCLLASAAAISLFQRARAASGGARVSWIALDAVVAGCGIWATHFIAMQAYGPGAGGAYNIPVTVLSLIFAIAVTFVGLSISVSATRTIPVALGGAVVGGGVAAMHYTGMMALEIPARIGWATDTVAVSIVLGIVFGSLALVVAGRRDGVANALGATVLLTVAIVSHHFTAMGAVELTPDPSIVISGMSIPPASLSVLTASAAVAIIAIALAAAVLDRRAKGELGRQQVVLDTALENMSQGLCMFDADGKIMLFNERYAAMLRRTDIALTGRLLVDVLREEQAKGQWQGDADEFFARLVVDAREGRTTSQVVNRFGRSIRVVNQPMQGGGWVATFEDITEWLEAQAKISHMARHDALTGLPNRVLFHEQLEQGLRRTGSGDQLAVLCLDLDHFKDINDSLGHPIGDALLKEVGRRLKATVGESDTVARLGGDEFAVVQIGRSEEAAARCLAGRLVEVISAPYEIDDHQIVIGVSIGISLSPQDGSNADELLKNADLALYRAKADGRGTYRFFETGMDARAQARRLLEMDLRAALQRDEFQPYYQPIRDVASGRVVVFEALLRWNHPQRGLIAPINFIPLAEETGLIVQLGEFVLRSACTDAATWPDDVDVAVNLSPVQFRNPNLIASVTAALTVSGLPARRLELEITESVLLQNSEATLTTLHELRAMGVRISLDDFGTGYSSLSYLRSFPFDKIKIDRSFVSELATREDSMAIIRAVTGLGRSLGIVTTAEGVENDAQLELLRREGCTQAQGYLFSKPRPASDVALMLERPRLRASA